MNQNRGHNGPPMAVVPPLSSQFTTLRDVHEAGHSQARLGAPHIHPVCYDVNFTGLDRLICVPRGAAQVRWDSIVRERVGVA
jgi:hypothetical protein